MKMNDTIIQESIIIASQTAKTTTETGDSINWWMWLAIVQFVIIAILLNKIKLRTKTTSKQRFKNESLKENIDFNNIINSSFHSISLYDELKVKCHPDRFPNDKEKYSIAESLFQEITKNQTNVKRLLELKEEAKNKLNINF